MSNFLQAYARELFARFRSIPVWPLSTTLSPGQVLDIRDGAVHHRGSLEDFGVDFEVRPGQSNSDTLRLGWRVHRTSAANLQTPPIPTGHGLTARVEADLAFEAEGAFLMTARNLVTSRIDVDRRLAARVAAAHERKGWDARLVIVESVTAVEELTLLLSTQPSGRAKVGVDVAALAALPLLESAASWSVRDDVVVEYHAATSTPMFTGLALWTSWWRDSELRVVAPGAAAGVDGELAPLVGRVNDEGFLRLLSEARA